MLPQLYMRNVSAVVLLAVSMWCVPLSHPGNGEFITVVFGQDSLSAGQGGQASQKRTAQDGATGILRVAGNALLCCTSLHSSVRPY